MNNNILIINFSLGLLLGYISSYMYNYSIFLYYTVFVPQSIILFIIINYKFKEVRE